ncbi:PEP-CTERM motif protein [Caulifigura coniformis]|uniref:PEP-CTERM motif protein n=1 Tax=Caulifigura coniformis TaxID=2527983 RepID=A0A517SC10_9PLAN|nr:PEP-CTERM sorting domain-containing protein [Caulifigura coniformis]QDT53670.1 PEP-CTERM motif protein [Caulifigura coniformis]
MFLAWADPTGTAFASDALPTVFDPLAWQLGQLTLELRNITFLGGTETSVSMVGSIEMPEAVPEPSSLLLTAAAAAGFAVRRRRLLRNRQVTASA